MVDFIMLQDLVRRLHHQLSDLGLWVPLRNAMVVAMVVAIGSVFLPNYYRSEARLLPMEGRGAGQPGGLASAAAAFGVNIQTGDSADSNFGDILSSNWLRTRLLDTEFDFHKRAWRFGADQRYKMTLRTFLAASNTDRGIKALEGILRSSRDIKTRVLTVSAETGSPELSRLLVLKSLELLESFVLDRNRTRGSVKAAYATARLKEARQEAEAAESELRRFLEGNRNSQGSGDPSVRLRSAHLESELRLRQQVVTTLVMSREQALMEEKNDMPILNVMDSPNQPIEKSGPVRSRLVLGALFTVGIGTWIFNQRAWLAGLFAIER